MKNKKFFKNDSEKLGYKAIFESNAIDSKQIPELDYISRENYGIFSNLVKEIKIAISFKNTSIRRLYIL